MQTVSLTELKRKGVGKVKVMTAENFKKKIFEIIKAEFGNIEDKTAIEISEIVSDRLNGIKRKSNQNIKRKRKESLKERLKRLESELEETINEALSKGLISEKEVEKVKKQSNRVQNLLGDIGEVKSNLNENKLKKRDGKSISTALNKLKNLKDS